MSNSFPSTHADPARVQQLWSTALAEGVGPEAVARGDAGLRDLLQVTPSALHEVNLMQVRAIRL